MSALEGGADIEYGCLTLPLLTDPDIGRSFYSRCSKALYVGWLKLENFLAFKEVGLINNPQGASLTLGADLQGLQLPCVTLLPTSPASLKFRTTGSLAQASTALLRAPRLMATG